MEQHIEPHPQETAAESWRLQLLPLMRGGLVLLACFFFVASLVQYHLLYQDLRKGSVMQRDAMEHLSQLQITSPQLSEIQQWQTLVTLEQEAMRMRYQQINATLLLRTWTRYTGFLVGMVLAVTGAFFILGRLKEDQHQISGEANGIKLMITSSSPGIILAVLGTLLMLVTLVVKFDFQVQDRPVYMPLYLLGSQEKLSSFRPPPFPTTDRMSNSPPQVPGADMESAQPIGPDDPPLPPDKTSLSAGQPSNQNGANR